MIYPPNEGQVPAFSIGPAPLGTGTARAGGDPGAGRQLLSAHAAGADPGDGERDASPQGKVMDGYGRSMKPHKK